MHNFISLIRGMSFSDLLDIAVIMLLVYGVFSVLRETRSSAAMRGLLAVLLAGFLIYSAARLLHLTATRLLFERFWIIFALIFLTVFQNEFRRALTEAGQMRIFR